METGSPGSHLDEDDFDWEAAVREIDTACQATVPSTSYSGEITPNFTPIILGGACPRPAVHPCRVRQSTLDRFVNDHAKQKTNNICRSEYGIHGSVEEDPWVRSNASELGDGPLSVSIDLEAAKTWIYPVNVPFRDYQYTIAKNALFSNTLVALPTGLGKTLIAAVVMYNYFRWFPEGKIVFAAPSRPLVMQQIEACHNIVGIPQEWTIDMTGLMCPSKRLIHWKTKRVFFLTPQVFEKDIQSGICLVRQLVCLVFDEAHRAMGNYSYCVVVRELMAMPIHLRILALTATPGSKHQTIQNVIDNLYISTIEYRNECDRDVNMYMHSRELELIVVPMGMDAVKINSMLLEAIQPSIARLSGIGVLPHRAFSTLSPSELLNLRDNFRQAPPPSLPYSKHGEIESYFSILITFYHIRKLLSSHGIRPAYEMIQDKLNQGSFLKFVSKIEVFWKAKYLMQQSLSHGAPTPKMVKMMEVLVDHFKTKDPKNSRVIIFSNFRGSVRDIMSYLSSIGDMIKATEFIGQCSGKTKGQTQKVQQAVLEKFRSGGYNVIVATSIGEEGLDIMEVDLVICFDANVSPLRMIQRMGRTGRKNDGRVVVLACEGSEHKAYLKKQASSKAIRKHMHNGGIKSFNFHPSPRMVPHICKPQVQYLEMSIEQFVHRRKKVKNVTLNGSPFSSNLSNEEQTLIAKYFPQNKDATWTPSLIAFPSFQVFPSQVSRVRHSFKTTSMFIDAMQDLQGLSFSKVNNDDVIEVETPSQPHDKLSDSRDNIGLGSAFGFPTSDIGGASFEVLPRQPLEDKNGFGNHHDFHKIKPHCFLFSKDSVTVSSLGSVLIAYVPVIQPRGSKNFPVISTINKSLFPEGLEPNDSRKVSGKPTMQVENSNIKAFTNLKQLGNELPSSLIINEIQNEQENNKHAFQDPDCEPNHQDSENSAAKINCNMEDVLSASIVGRSTNPVTNIEMSPRLTRFIEEGVVPESPMLNINILPPSGENRLFSTFSWEEDKAEYKSYVHYSTPPNIIRTSDMPSKETISDEKKITAVNNTPIENTKEKNIIYAANEAVHTSANMNQSSSEEWKCNSGEASYSLFKAPKYKRLCKQGDVIRKLPAKILEKSFKLVEAASSGIISTNENKIKYKNGEKEKPIQHVDAFIEEEAEVSDDASVSEDEVVDEKHERYDDSFIDDRINSTEGSTEAENSGVDMTTFYRRSLLTQSPTILPENYLATSGESLASGTTGSCSPEKQHNLIATPQHILQSADRLDFQNSVIGNAASATAASGEAAQPERCSDKLERRKRKLIFRPPEAIPEENSQLLLETRQPKLTKSDTFDDDDDDFFQGLDLDEVEAQATMLLRSRSELSSGKSQAAINDQDMITGNDFIGSLFDLGI